jgi:DNA-binding transcriptional LysR family regulator
LHAFGDFHLGNSKVIKLIDLTREILRGHLTLRNYQKEAITVQKSTMGWDDVQFFLSVARSGSARATALDLQISHTTVSRRIENLETSLGTRLFDRGVSGYVLTEGGQAMLEFAEQAEDVLLSAERHLHGKDTELSGDIRITTPDVIATQLLLPDLAKFTDKYRDIDIDLRISTNLYDLTRREVDIAIRFLGFGNPPPDPLIGRKLGSVASCFYATQEYLNRYDLNDPNTQARWLSWGEQERFPQWVKASPYPHIATRFQLDHGGTQIGAALACMGITMLPCFLGDTTPGLVRIPKAQSNINHEIWLLSHPDNREVTRLRHFREFVVESFASKQDLLAGTATHITPRAL